MSAKTVTPYDRGDDYLLSISTYTGAPSIELDDDRTVVLDDDTLAGIRELADLAQRGYDDYCHQAEHGEYSAEEIADASRHWELAKTALAALWDTTTKTRNPEINQ